MKLEGFLARDPVDRAIHQLMSDMEKVFWGQKVAKKVHLIQCELQFVLTSFVRRFKNYHFHFF